LIALAGAAVALWLVREHQIERAQPELATAREEQFEVLAA
jgi:hypothetical protein